MQRKTWWLLAITMGTVLLAGLILTDALPLLRGPAPETSEWYWPYLLHPVNQWWAAGGAALLMLAAAGWWFQDKNGGKWRNATAVLLLFLTSILLQLGLVYAHRPAVFPELIDRTLSNQSGGFFEAAAEIENVNALLAAYPDTMPAFTSDHARTHPPGLILANWLTIQLFRRLPALAETIAPHVWAARCTDLWLLNRPPAVAAALAAWSIIPLLAAALVVWPAWLLAKRLLPPPAAKLGAALAAALPSLLLFAPKSVQLYAPLTLFLLWSFHIGLETWSLRWFLAAGLLYGLATFLSLGNLALALLLLVYTLLTIWQRQSWRRTGWPRIVLNGAVFGAAGIAVWLVYWLGWGVAPWRIWQAGMAQHYTLVTRRRRYDWWLLWNLVDTAVYAGLPLFIGWLAGVTNAFKNGRTRRLSPANVLALSLLALLLLLNLSGSARGEVGRIWLFFLPLPALVTADFWHNTFPGRKTAVLLITLQLLLTISLGVAWQPVRAVIVTAAEPAMPANLRPATLSGVSFQEMGPHPAALTLNGYTINRDGDTLDVVLFWQGNQAAKRPFTVFAQLLNEKGQLVAQQDSWPANGQWPPTCWTAGQPVVDPRQLTLPPDLPPGPYTLITGWYDAATGGRLLTPAGDDFAELEQITVESPHHP